MGPEVLPTPVLASAFSPHDKMLYYYTLERTSRITSKPSLISLPFGKSFGEIKSNEFTSDDILLLPSLASLSYLGSNSGALSLQYQLSALDVIQSSIKPSQVIVRIFENTGLEQLQSAIDTLHSRGVRGAAFAFDGLLGDSDLESLLLRSKIPMSWLAIAVGRIDPGTIPLLYYLGFDVIDIGHAQEAAAKHIRLWQNGSESIIEDQQPRYCACASCQDLPDAKSSKTVELLQDHNINVYRSILSESVAAMSNGRLRWLVESMTHNSPAHASILRRVDRQMYAFLEEFTPASGTQIVPLIGPESYYSPAVQRFRENVVTRYMPPAEKRIVLLLPCSAKKPYSDSKSHRRFLETLEASLGNATSHVAQVILTSPLGLVPRELERIFPAANYDIPVTGEWDTEETTIAADALITHLKKFSQDVVIVAHVSGGYLGIVNTAEDSISHSIIYTSPDTSPTSRESRNALYETLTDMKTVLELGSKPSRVLEEIVRATADFQFGRGAGDLLVPENARLKGKVYRQILCRIGNEQVCSFIADSGLLSLTLDGAKRLAQLGHYWVRLDAHVVKGGSVFAVGVQEADTSIRPGDEVIIFNNNDEVIAVGRSEMSGREMCELERGRAVSIRHKLEG